MPQSRQPIHDIAADATSKNNIPEITLALKVLGNAGHPASLKPIMKLLPGLKIAATSLPLRVHVDAILALRNIAKKEPKLASVRLCRNKLLQNDPFSSKNKLTLFLATGSASGPAACIG